MTDIDKLLEATVDLDEDVQDLMLSNVEIDWLLEVTQDL
ncbi:hypothetical protein J2S07_000003 [Robertmurraya andreesenii]|uniref:Uncharacterized protein n=1 Tax=Anoxybacillus andreesenii TaxID=1325932 RepID=A0ABT9UYJ1_9BACL|nr:hypothetical protein [Robertmurraya andreesenii]